MSLLQKATKPEPTKSPIILTLCGEAGSGKSSLASTFPNAFIIRTGGEAMPRDIANAPDELPPLGGKKLENGSWDESELFDQLVALLKEDHAYKTLIVDSITGLEDLFVQAILDVQPPKQKSMNAAGNGFGSAWDIVAGKHGRLRKAAEMLRTRRGMNVVFIGHVEVDRVDPPDGVAYTKYNLQLNKKTAPIYVNNSCCVAFLKQDRIIMEGGKAQTSDDRVLVVETTPANVSKNRLGIVGNLKVQKGVNPFAEYINGTKGE